MSEDKWLDEILGRTEKEEILDSIKRALDYLDDLDVRKAYNVLELLAHSLDGYDVGKQVEEYEGHVEKVPAVPRVWSTGGTPPQHRHRINHGDLNEMSYAHDHHSLANLDEELEKMTASAVAQALAEIEQRMVERDKDLLEMAKVWEGYAEKAEKHVEQIGVDTAIFEKLTGVTAAPIEEETEPFEEYLEALKEGRYRGDSSG